MRGRALPDALFDEVARYQVGEHSVGHGSTLIRGVDVPCLLGAFTGQQRDTDASDADPTKRGQHVVPGTIAMLTGEVKSRRVSTVHHVGLNGWRQVTPFGSINLILKRAHTHARTLRRTRAERTEVLVGSQRTGAWTRFSVGVASPATAIPTGDTTAKPGAFTNGFVHGRCRRRGPMADVGVGDERGRDGDHGDIGMKGMAVTGIRDVAVAS